MYTRVTGPNFTHCLKKEVITVGRRSPLPIDICLGDSACISRKHLELHTINGSLFLRILGKNGIFINEEFQMFSEDLIPVPNCCRLRFPSTPITLVVEVLGSNSSSRHPKKRTIWRYSAEIAGLVDLNPEIPHYTEEKRLRLATSPLEGDESPRQIEKPISHISYNTLITDCSINGPQSKSESTEPFSTPEPYSPPDALLSSSTQTNARRPATTTTTSTDQPTSLRFPNLLAAYSQSSLKPGTACSQTSNGTDNSNTLSGAPDRCSSQSSVGPSSPLNPPGGEDVRLGASPDQEGSAGTVEHGTVYEKPPYSYAQLIVQAIVSAPNRRLTLSDIYNYISTQFPYYKPSQKGWQNSIRHNLSLNRYFIRIPRGQEEPGKGAFWRLDPESEAHLVVKAFQKRRQRSYAVPAYVTGGNSPQVSSGVNSTNNNVPVANNTVSPLNKPPTFFEDRNSPLGLNSKLFKIRNPVSTSSNSAVTDPIEANFLAKNVLVGDLPLFKNPSVSSDLLTRDDSILASSLLFAGNSLLNGSSGSETAGSTTTTNPPAAQIYSQFRNYYNLSEKSDRNPFVPPVILPKNFPNPTVASTGGDSFSIQMPNLAASLLRSRAGSLNRRASEPNLQKFVPSNTAASAENSVSLQLNSAQEQLLRVLRGNALIDKDSSKHLTPAPTFNEFDNEPTIFVRESDHNQSTVGSVGSPPNKSNPPIATKH